MKVKINTHGNPLPEQHGDWIDLSLADNAYLRKDEYRLLSLGVSMELPDGYYAEVVPRSSTPGKWGIILANSFGVIDHDYCGDDDIWKFPAYALRDTFIPKGTRIAQFKVVKQGENVEFEKVDHLEGENRGGIGSTGN